MSIPTHIAFILDGNGRWAQARGLRRYEGHKEGLATVEKIIDHSIEAGVKIVSLYVFSTENWKRPEDEVKSLFFLAEKYLNRFSNFCKNRIRVVISGEKEGLPPKLVKKIESIQQKTSQFDAICVNLCINYGGRREIAEAAKQIAKEGGEFSEQNIANHLYNSFIPEPDLIIRTGGQRRLSNFLMYQSAYAELYFTDTLWPDFDGKEYDDVLRWYGERTRNFGGL